MQKDVSRMCESIHFSGVLIATNFTFPGQIYDSLSRSLSLR